MKYAPTIAGALLGLAFTAFGLLFFFGPKPPPMPPSPAAAFMDVMIGTEYMAFVKVLEIAGGLLTALPRTRNAGLLILGPIIVNILAFHIFINNGATLVYPVLILI